MTTNTKRYNGWTNYETWCVALWIDNEQSLYNESRAMVAEVHKRAADSEQVASGVWTLEQAQRFAAADALKEWVEDMCPELGASMWSDLLSAALSEVDWHEIADHYAPEPEATK